MPRVLSKVHCAVRNSCAVRCLRSLRTQHCLISGEVMAGRGRRGAAATTAAVPEPGTSGAAGSGRRERERVATLRALLRALQA